MNDSHSESNSELIQEVRNGFIDLRSLHRRIAEEQNDLNQKNHILLSLLTALAFAIVFCLLSLDVRLFKVLDANPGLKPNNHPSAVESQAARVDASRVEASEIQSGLPNRTP